jgi:hypothetical protein
MDSTLITLKEEINKTLESEHDLAKWKLVVTAALGAAAFGSFEFGKNGSSPSPNYWLLLLIPFVCAYVDLFDYQYQLRILVIAHFLRSKDGQGDPTLHKYEQQCEAGRGSGSIFSLGGWGLISSSLGASFLAATFYYLHNRYHHPGTGSLLLPPSTASVIWLVGVAIILWLKVKFEIEKNKLSAPVIEIPCPSERRFRARKSLSWARACILNLARCHDR